MQIKESIFRLCSYYFATCASEGGRHCLRSGVTPVKHYGLSVAALSSLPPQLLQHATRLANVITPQVNASCHQAGKRHQSTGQCVMPPGWQTSSLHRSMRHATRLANVINPQVTASCHQAGKRHHVISQQVTASCHQPTGHCVMSSANRSLRHVISQQVTASCHQPTGHCVMSSANRSLRHVISQQVTASCH